MVIEQRRYARAPIQTPLTFFVKGSSDQKRGTAKDIAVGGMSVEAADPAPFGSEIIVNLQLPGSHEVMALPAIVRWVRDGSMGLQFGLLGAVETHLITEIHRKHAQAPASSERV